MTNLLEDIARDICHAWRLLKRQVALARLEAKEEAKRERTALEWLGSAGALATIPFL